LKDLSGFQKNEDVANTSKVQIRLSSISITMYLAFLTGLLGSLHCLGMCGPLVMALPGKTWQIGLRYQAGRLLTYSLLGGLLGFLGKGLELAFTQLLLAIATGLLIWSWLLVGHAPLSRFGLGSWQKWLRQRFTPFMRQKNMFMLGVLNGLLPCGLIYLALAGAIYTASFTEGAFYMLAFGTGTLPALLSLGYLSRKGISLLGKHVQKTIAVLAFLAGMVLIVRGMNLVIPYVSPQTTTTGIGICH
jgi:sulfite exporter TauE/SafE